MNYKTLTVCLTLLSLNPLTAIASEKGVEARTAAFFFSSSLMSDIYGKAGENYQIEVFTKLSDYFMGWANFSWISKHGSSIGLSDPTKVTIPNISFGIKLPYQITHSFAPYVGIGPIYADMSLKEESQCGKEHLSKGVFGGVLKSGAYFNINKNIFIDAFVDYIYQPANFETKVDIGGVQTGIGLGIRF